MPPWDEAGHVFVIAEIGVNHNGDPELAKKLIDVAAEAGADAVKFQTFNADELVTPTAEMAGYQKRNLKSSSEQHGMLRALELTGDQYRMLRDYCGERGVEFLSTPFDEASADLLERLDVDAFKISSGDLTHHALLAHIAGKGLPMVVSTGMSTLGEIEEALEVIAGAGNPPVALLHCVSNYPAAIEDCNLSAMATMSRAFGRPVGWSDHTEGDVATIAAVALGARIIEKHFTLDRDLPGPDHKASLEPDELTAMIRSIRMVSKAMGDGVKRPTEHELDTARVARRSLVASRDIPAGARIERDMIAIKRPGTGIAPRHARDFVGLVARQHIPANTLLSWSHTGGSGST